MATLTETPPQPSTSEPASGAPIDLYTWNTPNGRKVSIMLEEAGAKEVMENLPDAPGYSSVRTHLRKLVDKGYLDLRESGLRYLYFPRIRRAVASRSALGNVVKTFFGDSPGLAVNQLLNMNIEDISRDELEDLEKLIRRKLEQKNE